MHCNYIGDVPGRDIDGCMRSPFKPGKQGLLVGKIKYAIVYNVANLKKI